MGLLYFFSQNLQHKNTSAQDYNAYSTTIKSISTTYHRKIYSLIINKKRNWREQTMAACGHDSHWYVNVWISIMDKETKMSSNQKKKIEIL